MKRFIASQLFLLLCLGTVCGQSVLWNPDKNSNGIIYNGNNFGKAHADHIEMSGEKISIVLRWGTDENKAFFCERSIVFPLLRTVPNNTHASLMHRVVTDIPSLVTVDGCSLSNEQVQEIKIDGYLGVKSSFVVSRDFNSLPEPGRVRKNETDPSDYFRSRRTQKRETDFRSQSLF